MEPSTRIMKMLAMLADQTGEKVSQERSDFYAERLLPLGADQVCEALSRMLETCRRFPTVGEIKSEMGVGEPTDDDKGREVAERIYNAIVRIGSINGTGEHAKQRRDKLAEMLGPVGHTVVEMQGGWNRLCEVVMEENATTWKAQWREFAAVIIRRGGDMSVAPQLEGRSFVAFALEAMPNVIDISAPRVKR